MLKAYKYRFYPTKKQAMRLQEVFDRCRELYNAALQERRDAYRLAHVNMGYNQQAAQLPEIKEVRPEYKAGSPVPLHNGDRILVNGVPSATFRRDDPSPRTRQNAQK